MPKWQKILIDWLREIVEKDKRGSVTVVMTEEELNQALDTSKETHQPYTGYILPEHAHWDASMQSRLDQYEAAIGAKQPYVEDFAGQCRLNVPDVYRGRCVGYAVYDMRRQTNPQLVHILNTLDYYFKGKR